MRILLPFLVLIYIPICTLAQPIAPGTPVYKVPDVVRSQLKGQVKTLTSKWYEKGKRVTAQWEPSDTTSYLATITYFNRRGFIDSSISRYVFEGKPNPAMKSINKYAGDSLIQEISYYENKPSISEVEYPNPFSIVKKFYESSKKSKTKYLGTIYETIYDDSYRAQSYSSKHYNEQGALISDVAMAHRYAADIEYVRTTDEGKTTNVEEETVAKDERGNRTIVVGRHNDGTPPSITVYSYEYHQ